MHDATDIDLLQQYAHRNSNEAFATLVQRHVNLVYSAALRKTGNPHAAEEITQAVFIILAKKAGSLREGTILSGWLYQAARLTSANFLRNEIRRAHREQEAYMQSLSNEPEPNVWLQIAPHLEDAMGQLGEKDRNAIALRFFEGKSFQEVGTAFGASENAAKKRVAYALEKLRKYFSKRGIVSTTAIIAGIVSANSVQAAPVALATSISAAVVAKGATAGASTLTLVKGALKLMAWTKAKTAIAISAAVVLTAGTGIVVKEFVTHDDGSVKTLIQFDLQKLRDEGQLPVGEIVRIDGSAVLKLVGTNELGIGMRLLTISNPPITQMEYAVVGEIKYDVELDGHLAMWNLFPSLEPGGQLVPYPSYTGALEDPKFAKIHRSSDWREFSLPLDRTGKIYPDMDPAVTAKPPVRLEVSIHSPGIGTVYLRNVKLVQWKAPPQIASR